MHPHTRTNGAALSTLLRSLLLVALVGVMVACATPPAPTATPKPAPTQAPAKPTDAPKPTAVPPTAVPMPTQTPGPKKGGTLTLVRGVDVLSFDPTAFHTGNEAYFHQMYDTLLRIGPGGKLTPCLAESWQWSADNKAITFKLRKGAKFHTGREITSADVAWTIERYKSPELAANLRPKVLLFTGVETPDPQTVTIKLDQPYGGIYDVLDLMFIQNKDVIADIKTKGAGSGPYMLAEWKPGEMFRLKRFPDYWDKNVAYLDEIVVLAVKDFETQIAMLQSGKADVIARLPGISARQFEGSKDVTILKAAPGASTTYIMMNVTKPPFDNKKVRQAIGYAIDRQRMARTVYPGGEGEAACIPFPPTHWVADATLAASCTYNLDKAKQLLAEAGFANGFKFSCNVATPDYSPGSKETAQILQDDLKKIGVEMEIQVFEAAEARQRIYDSNFTMLIHQYSGASTDPAFNLPGRTLGGTKDSFSKYYSDELSQMITKAAAEVDQAKRKPLYVDVMKKIQDEAYVHPTVFRYILFAVAKRVHGLDFDLSGYPDLSKTWVD